MPEQNLHQSQELRQEQILAPQQIQSLEILLAPLLQLQEKLSQEIQENPVLELEKTPGEDLAGDPVSDVSGDDLGAAPESPSAKEKESDEQMEEIVRFADTWQDYLPPAHSRSFYTSEDEERRQHFFDSLTDEASLQEQLLEQLRLSEADKKTAGLAELIIGSIDDSGYLRSHIADIAILGNADVGDVEKALAFVQTFDPPGIGARDFKECLLIQLRRKKALTPLLEKLIVEHLDDIARNHLPQVAKKLKVDLNQLYELLETIRALTPYPGSACAPGTPIFVIPEIIVEKQDGKFVVVSNDDQFPRLRISNLYRELLENPDTPEETKNYIREKIVSGKNLIKSIEQRKSTIRRIADVVVAEQADFLEHGVEKLRPMTMQHVAEKLDLHETTISRAISNKYIKTPVGLFELRFFFSGGYQSDGGESLSSKSVKEKIRDLILKEDPFDPLSDDKISKILKDQGLSVARRTVAKYREEMNIQSSHLRKEFK